MIVISWWTVADVLAILRVALWFRDNGNGRLLVEVHHQFVDFRRNFTTVLAAGRVHVGWA